MTSACDNIRSPLHVPGRPLREVPCPMLTAAVCNHEMQCGRPRYVQVTGDTGMYGDALVVVNAIEQRLGRLDGVLPVKVGGYAEVCLIALLYRRLKESGVDAVVLLEGDVVRCRHSAEVVKRVHADAMVKAGRRKNPNVCRQSADVRMMSDALLHGRRADVLASGPA